MNLLAIDGNLTYTCGNLGQVFSGTFPYFTHIAIVIIKIAIPILLVILGMLDLWKAVAASKEDEIKKGQQMFVKRIVAAVLVFLVTLIVQIVVKFISTTDSEKTTVANCMNCFVNGEVSEKGCVASGEID